MDENPHFRRTFRDVIRGFSEVSVLEETVYIKHLSAHDQVDVDLIYDKHLNLAKKRGIQTEKETLSQLLETGDWSEDKDNEIKRLELFCKQLAENKTQLVLKSEIDAQNKELSETRIKISKIKEEKDSLLVHTAEAYASKRSNDYYVIKSFYKDKELASPLFPNESDYSELYTEELKEYVVTYNKTFSNFDETKIQEMILQDFYYIYFPFSDDTVGFFGRPVVELTYNQLKLIVYTKIFKGIFENNKHIPEKIRKDPQALLDFGSVSDDAKEKMRSKYDSNADASTLFNATDEDFEYAGLEKPSDSPGVSLQKAAEDKGGSLSMEDLMELSGHRTK